MNDSRHLAALSPLIRGQSDELLSALDPSEEGIARFVAFLSHHQLFAFTQHQLRASSDSKQLPKGLQTAIDDHAHKLQAKNRRLKQTLPVLRKAFDDESIPFIVLKGLHLALKYYGGIERRTFWDMDILVATQHVPKAHQLLMEMGYSRISSLFVNDRLSRYFGHAYDYRRNGGLDIDLHWKLSGQVGISFNEKRIWDSRQSLQLDDTPFFALADETALFFLMATVVKDLERGALRLRSLVDLYLMLRSMDANTDWPGFFDRREREGTLRMVIEVVTVVFLLFGVSPQEFPAISEALSHHPAATTTMEKVVMLLAPGAYALNNKRWAAPLYPVSGPTYAAWWAVSLPARMVLHGSASRRRKK